MRRLALALTSTLLLAAGCAATCEQACDNLARVCEAELARARLQLDRDTCVSSCEDNLAACGNSEARIACLAEAGSCEQSRSCPACAP
jgi:hypothetical protein